MGIRLMIASVLAAAGLCSAQADERLAGAWTASPEQGETHSFEFDGEGGLNWTIKRADSEEVYPLVYQTEFLEEIDTITIKGFLTGPLKGKTLYGVFVLGDEANSLRLDFEPGEEGDASVRPAALTDEAWTLTRVP